MAKIVSFTTPKESVSHKIFMYFSFTIAMAWSQIVIHFFISSIFTLTLPKLILYTHEICFMTIVLTANNIRDLADGNILKRGKLLFDILISLNVLNFVFSLVFSAGSSVMKLSGSSSQPNQKQFCFVIVTYIAAVLMGLAVQIGGGIDGYNN